MKQKIIVIFAVLSLLAAACKPTLEPPEDSPGDSGLVVELLRLELDKTELATIVGHPLKLNVTKTPSFATKNEVIWKSSNPDAATVDQDGNIETGAVTDPLMTVIRVESTTDPSVYAECPVTVYPDYGSNRYWNLGPAGAGWYAFKEDASAGEQKSFGDTSVLTADLYMGNGMTLKGQTGSGNYEFPSETPNGLPLEGGLIPSGADKSAYPPYPWVYEIDPENPYAAGLTPTNSTRTGMNWRTDNPAGMDFRAGDLVTNGNGRIFSIAALQGPFSIEVRYTTNSDGAARWADIRIGDTDGLRIQGSPSTHRTTVDIGRGIVSYTYPNKDIVPFVYIESQGSIRIYEVIIKAEEAQERYTPVQSVNITPATVALLDGETANLTAVVSPPAATNPAYNWEIIDGNGAVTSGANTSQAVVSKIGKTGGFTVKLTVTTTDPDTGEETTKTAERQIEAAPYKAVTGADISGAASVKNGSTITLNAAVTPEDATYPEYTWTIAGTGASIDDGVTNGATFTIKGMADSGSVTVNLSVKTEGYGGGATATKTASKTITLEAGSSGGGTLWNFSEAPFNTLPATWTDTQTKGDVKFIGGGGMAYNENKKTYDGIGFTQRVQLNGAGSTTGRAVSFDVTGSCTVRIYAISGNSTTPRNLALSDGTNEITKEYEGATGGGQDFVYSGGPATLYVYSKSSGINLYGIKVTY
jgi:uncharacterized protein YjdB